MKLAQCFGAGLTLRRAIRLGGTIDTIAPSLSSRATFHLSLNVLHGAHLLLTAATLVLSYA
jgi:hypothetical protein